MSLDPETRKFWDELGKQHPTCRSCGKQRKVNSNGQCRRCDRWYAQMGWRRER